MHRLPFRAFSRGKRSPNANEKIIGNTFIDVFDGEAQQLKDAQWLAQGTIYPDVIESVSVNGPSVTIKSHHNVGGLPDYMKLKVVEPLRMLLRMKIAPCGKKFGNRPQAHRKTPFFLGQAWPFEFLGAITAEKVRMLQEVDGIFIQALRDWELYDKVWQAGAILLPVNSVGVMGDERTYEKCVALRAVESTDGMTADWVDLPYEFLQKVSNTIINNVRALTAWCMI